MDDIIRNVTVHRHKLFGEIRTVKDDDGYYLFIVSDLSSFLKKKNIMKTIEKQNIEVIKVKINCVMAINNNEKLLDERIVSAIKEKDMLHLVRSSQISSSRFMEMWIRRDVLRDDSMWSKDISFNREYYKDEYIELQIAELDLLKAKVEMLSYDILRKYKEETYYEMLEENSIEKKTTKNQRYIEKTKMYGHKLFGEIRVIEKDNEVLFIGNDVAKALKYKSPQMAVKSHCAKLTKVSIKSEIYLANKKEYSYHITAVNVIGYEDVQRLIKYSSKVDKRMFELWIRSEVLNEDNNYDKEVVYQGEFYKDEYIKVLAKDIEMYREKVRLLEEELYSQTEKVVQENVDLVTNYDLAKKLETVFKVTKKKK